MDHNSSSDSECLLKRFALTVEGVTFEVQWTIQPPYGSLVRHVRQPAGPHAICDTRQSSGPMITHSQDPTVPIHLGDAIPWTDLLTKGRVFIRTSAMATGDVGVYVIITQ